MGEGFAICFGEVLPRLGEDFAICLGEDLKIRKNELVTVLMHKLLDFLMICHVWARFCHFGCRRGLSFPSVGLFVDLVLLVINLGE